MTLMTVTNSEGSRRCDQNCYAATGPICDCVCRGMNHGKGLQSATENTAAWAEKLLNEYATHPDQHLEIPLFTSPRLL